jgi:hypothetical protein
MLALPTVASLAECADYHKTVAPFLPQLYDLPGRLLESYADRDALLGLYLETNPFVSAAAFSLAVAAVVCVLAEVNRNYSQIDRAWSVLPVIYNAHFSLWARLAGLAHARTDLATLFSVIWGVRVFKVSGPCRV